MFHRTRPAHSRKRLWLLLFAALAALLACLLLLFSRRSAPANAEAAARVLPVYGVETDKKVVALTIDAAWGADKTPEILEILEEKQVTATFFLVGRWVREFPEETAMIVASGHPIGSHSDSHAHFCSLTDAQIQEELDATAEALAAAGAKAPTLFRAPYGEYDDRVVTKLRSAGYQVIQWTVDTLDWQEDRTVEQVLEVVARKAAPGAIILCHNNANTIADYLPTLIDNLRAEGYEFVAVEDLLYEGFNIDNNGIQHPEPAPEPSEPTSNQPNTR